MMAMMTTEACCQVPARHNISLDHQHGDQFFDQVAVAVTPTKLTSACFIGINYKDLITFMCSDERTVPIINVDPRQDLHRQGVMVGAALTMGNIYGGAMGAILAGTDAVVFGMARTAGKRVRDYLVSAPRSAKDHTVLGIIPFLARVQVDRNSRGTESAEACMRAGCMYEAPHIKILNAQSTDGTFGSKYANEVAGLRSFDSEDTRIEIQRSMSAHEIEKHEERLGRQLPHWNISQAMGTGPLNITQMIIQQQDLCDIYIVCYKSNGQQEGRT